MVQAAEHGADRRALQHREIEDQEGAHEAKDEPARERDEVRDLGRRGFSHRQAGAAVDTRPRETQRKAYMT